MSVVMEAGVLGACLSASFKLIFVCVGSGWLLNSGLIPEETASVLSKVSVAAALRKGLLCLPFCSVETGMRVMLPCGARSYGHDAL